MSTGSGFLLPAGQTLLLATSNPGKVREFRDALQDLGWKIKDSSQCPGMPVVPEEGETFQDNALLKARTVATWSGLACLADDSGLEVDALDGEPGIFSARFAGSGSSDAANNRKLLLMLRDVPWERRTARFVCALALALPSGREVTARGALEGFIDRCPRGDGGFGYDPLFYLPRWNCTMAELALEEKNRISHRGQALQALKQQLAGLKPEKGSEL